MRQTNKLVKPCQGCGLLIDINEAKPRALASYPSYRELMFPYWSYRFELIRWELGRGDFSSHFTEIFSYVPVVPASYVCISFVHTGLFLVNLV